VTETEKKTSYAPYGLRVKEKIEPSRYSREFYDLVGEVETTASGNTVLRIGRENRAGWEQIAHVVLVPSEAWLLAAEICDKPEPDEVIRRAREVIKIHQAGPKQYDWEEYEGAIAALADALPPEHHDPIVRDPDDPDQPF
jgi:hypothetical protein